MRAGGSAILDRSTDVSLFGLGGSQSAGLAITGYLFGPREQGGGAVLEQPNTALATVGGRYVIESRIGIGGQAAVYKVFDERLRVHRAIKVLLPEFARRPPLRERFESEAHAMANLDHPNIVRVFDVVPDAHLPFIVMEFVPGGSLAQWIERNGPVPPRLAVRCAMQSAAAVGAAHRAGVIHRDVKPHNILIDAKGVCKLGDFGIARATEGSLRTLRGSRMGTEGYMAPEQSKDASGVDARADLFGLGVSLWVMLAAMDPVELFRRGTFEGVPEPLQRVIRRAISPNPEDRHANARALAMDLDAAVSQLGGDPPTPPLIQATPSEIDDYGEISMIVRRRRRSVPAPTEGLRPPVIGYVMPAYAERNVEAEPDWIVPEARREPVQTYAIRPGASTPPPPPPAWDRPRHTVGAGYSTMDPDPPQSFWDPLRPEAVLALFMPAVAATLSLLVLSHVIISGAAREVERSSVVFQRVLNEDFVVVDSLEALGADSYQLQNQWRAVVYARSALERDTEALAFVELLEAQAARVVAPGSTTWERAKIGVGRIVSARDSLVDAHQQYRNQSTLFRMFAWGTERPPLPAPRSRPAERLGTELRR